MIRDRWIAAARTLPPPTPASADVVRAAAVVAVIGTCAQIAIQLVNGIAFDSRYDTLNPDRDTTVFAWASASATVVAAAAVLLLGVIDPSLRRGAWLLAAVLSYLSVDDALAYHELISRKVFVSGLGLDSDIGPRLFPVLFAPVLLLGLYLIARIAVRAAPPAAAAIVVGLLFFGCAIAAELASGVLSSADVIHFEEWPDVVLAAAEEGLELAGWLLVAGAFLAEVIRIVEQRAPGSASAPHTP